MLNKLLQWTPGSSMITRHVSKTRLTDFDIVQRRLYYWIVGQPMYPRVEVKKFSPSLPDRNQYLITPLMYPGGFCSTTTVKRRHKMHIQKGLGITPNMNLLLIGVSNKKT